MKFIAILLVLFLLCNPAEAQGADAEFFFTSRATRIISGEMFELEVRIKAGERIINAVEGEILVPNGVEIVDIITAGSVVSLWMDKPVWKINEKILFFSGIIPGGYWGELTPNGLESTNGLLFNIIGRGQKGTEIKYFDFVFSSSTKVMLNDGAGTEGILSVTDLRLPGGDPAQDQSPEILSPTHPVEGKWYDNNAPIFKWQPREGALYSYSLGQDPNVWPDDIEETDIGAVQYPQLENGIWYFLLREKELLGQWKNPAVFQVMVDNTSPEPIQLELVSGENFGNQYNLLFISSDKVSDIDYYEVWEGKEKFFPAVSPYILKHQNLGEKIVVRAFDKAGNAREASFMAPSVKWGLWYYLIAQKIKIAAVLAIILFICGIWRVYVYKKKK